MPLPALARWARELKAQVLTLWFGRSHPDMPLAAKLVAILVVAYALSPIDLIPDFIPVLGYLDDLILLPAGIWLALSLMPAHVAADSRRRANEWLESRQARPRSYAAAAVIVLAWLAACQGLWIFVFD